MSIPAGEQSHSEIRIRPNYDNVAEDFDVQAFLTEFNDLKSEVDERFCADCKCNTAHINSETIFRPPAVMLIKVERQRKKETKSKSKKTMVKEFGFNNVLFIPELQLGHHGFYDLKSQIVYSDTIQPEKDEFYGKYGGVGHYFAQLFTRPNLSYIMNDNLTSVSQEPFHRRSCYIL